MSFPTIENPRKSLRTSYEMKIEIDRISDLPGHIIDRILSFLPIKNAVRTSLLSTKWRNKWETIPRLVFDRDSFPIAFDDDDNPMIDKLIKDIDRVLMLHTGPIHEFELSYDETISHDELDKWIHCVSRHSPKSFTYELYDEERYKMPYCVFSWKNLTHLVIRECLLRPPLKFKGFKHLKSLELKGVSVAQDVLECIISSSRVLSRLTLSDMGLKKLNIDAPNLQFFKLSGRYEDISLKCVNLVEFSVYDFDFYISKISENFSYCSNLAKIMAGIPKIARLTVAEFYCESLAICDIPRELPHPCLNLYYLSIGIIDLTCFNESSALLCLLRSAPNLQELHLRCAGSHDDFSKPGSEFWFSSIASVGVCSNHMFMQLRSINITNVHEADEELDFIGFMLLNSPVLESLVVEPTESLSNINLMQIMARICSFKRASILAKVDCYTFLSLCRST